VLPAVWLPADTPAEEHPGKVVVVYASDADGFTGLLHSMLSLARHLEDPGECVVHLIVPREDLPRARRLLDCWRRELGPSRTPPEAVLLELRPPGRLNVSSLRRPAGRSDSSVASNLARDYLPEYLPGVPRALWLDIDTIVQTDIAPLFRMPMRHTVAAASELVFGAFRLHEIAPPDIRGRIARELAAWSTFNAGVLLVDLRRWEAENATGKVEAQVRLLRGWSLDIMALNLVFLDRFDLLGQDWNFQDLEVNLSESGLARRMAKVLHWHGRHKPWRRGRPEGDDLNDFLFRAHDCGRPCDDLC